MKSLSAIFLSLILLSGCNGSDGGWSQGDAGSGQISSPGEGQDFVEAEGFDWGDNDLLAVNFMGYVEGVELENYLDNPEFAIYIDNIFGRDVRVEAIDTGGDELFLLIPRYGESTLRIGVNEEATGATNTGDYYYEGPAVPVLLKTNMGDLYTDVEVYMTLGDLELVFMPQVDLMDGTLILPEEGVLDISSYYGAEDFYLENISYLLDGDWFCDVNGVDWAKEGIILSLRLDDENYYRGYVGYDFEYIVDFNYDKLVEGRAYFALEEEWMDPENDGKLMLYFDQEGIGFDLEGNAKYELQVEDYEKISLFHLEGEPLQAGMPHMGYDFARTYG